MKLYSIISGLGLGGAEQCVVNLANGLLDQGHNFSIFTLEPRLKKQIPAM